MRRALGLLALPLAVGACILPRTVYLEDEERHLLHHQELSATFEADCLPELAPADPDRAVPRPAARPPDHVFPGDATGQREHVWLEEDIYAYAERWGVGILGDWAILRVGWDWKVHCRIETCRLSEDVSCCYQECIGGGASGLGFEPPNRTGCLNTAAGGADQWFVDGLREAGVPGAEVCR